MAEQQTQPQKQASAKKKKTNIKKPKRGFGWVLNLILLVGIAALGYLFFQAEQQRTALKDELQQTSSQLQELRNTSQDSGTQEAANILSKVRNHIEVPSSPEPTVATITNIEELKKTNEFYNKAENGDNLVITENRAILYDPDRDIIIDVVPVNITQQEGGNSQAATSPGASPQPDADEDTNENTIEEAATSPTP